MLTLIAGIIVSIVAVVILSIGVYGFYILTIANYNYRQYREGKPQYKWEPPGSKRP